jgi:hypothetical protein
MARFDYWGDGDGWRDGGWGERRHGWYGWRRRRHCHRRHHHHSWN